MSMMQLTYTTKDVATLLGFAVKNTLARAARESWRADGRPGRGGGRMWLVSSMPTETRELLASALLRQSRRDRIPTQTAQHAGNTTRPVPTTLQAPVPTGAQVPPPPLAPAVPATDFSRASDRERRTALARLAFVREVERLSAVVGKEGSIQHLVDASRKGKLPEHLAVLVQEAVATKRGEALSRRSLYRWCTDYATRGESGLLPVLHRDYAIPDWAEEFLRYYQKPQKPPVSVAYEEFCAALAVRGIAKPPSVDAVRRFLKKMSTPEREAGRVTGNALLKLRPYKRRTTEELWPTDIYTADGTTFDAEVLHPHKGKPFKPEITLVLDVGTRRCVGISIGLAESAFTILDAVRAACCFGGIPAMFYSDNGPGYVNKVLLDDSTGIFLRLGITPAHAIPGRPQGKGLMERAIKTICVKAAQKLPSYTGALMDRDAAQKQFKLSRKAVKKGARSTIPTWKEFTKHILQCVDQYNARPHSRLPRYRDTVTGKMRHMSPDEYWQSFVSCGFAPVVAPAGMYEELFMPGQRRKVHNGYVEFCKGEYFAKELAEFHGEYVEVRYDIWDASRVWCWTTQGQRICVATLDGNGMPYFPPSQIEAARARREKGQVARLNAKLQEVDPGAKIVTSGEQCLTLADSTAAPVIEVDFSVLPEKEALPLQRPVLFQNAHERYVFCRQNPDLANDSDHEFLPRYAASEEYADLADLYVAMGIPFTR